LLLKRRGAVRKTHRGFVDEVRIKSRFAAKDSTKGCNHVFQQILAARITPGNNTCKSQAQKSISQ